jgi:hypothetical protein
VIERSLLNSPGMSASYGKLWIACKETIKSKVTFGLYLSSLEKQNIIKCQRTSRKSVTFTLNEKHRGLKDVKKYVNRPSILRKDFRGELEALKSGDRRMKSAEIMSQLMSEFESRILDTISTRAQRTHMRFENPATALFEKLELEELPELLASQITRLYLADPAFTFAMLHVLMTPRKEIQFNRKREPLLFASAHTWLHTETQETSFDLVNDERERH